MSNELIELIQAMKIHIKELSPDVCVIETDEIFEDEHANLEVYPPLTWINEQCRALQHQSAGHASDIHIDTGYLILVYVCTPEQQVAEAQHELVRVKKKIQSAEKILTEAGQLGLLKPTPAQAKLVVV
jgi:hypothetical protein